MNVFEVSSQDHGDSQVVARSEELAFWVASPCETADELRATLSNKTAFVRPTSFSLSDVEDWIDIILPTDLKKLDDALSLRYWTYSEWKASSYPQLPFDPTMVSSGDYVMLKFEPRPVQYIGKDLDHTNGYVIKHNQQYVCRDAADLTIPDRRTASKSLVG